MTNYSTHLTLLDRLSAGSDPAAWREFQERYGLLIRGMARRQGLQDADCDEIVQEVLTILSRAMPGFRYDPSKGLFRSYLKTITLRTIYARKQGQTAVVGVEGLMEEAIDDDALEASWEMEWRQYHLRRAMHVVDQEFNPTDRAAFAAYAIRGENADETAQNLEMTIDQVYQAKSRILKRLKYLIQTQVHQEG